MKRLPALLPRPAGRRAAFKVGFVATLAIAVAANIAVLGNLGVLFGRVVPGAAHQDLLAPSFASDQFPSQVQLGVPWPVYNRLAREPGIGDKLAAFKAQGEMSGRVPSSKNINLIQVTPSLAAVLGIRPVAGRLFVAGDTKPGAAKTAVVSANLARKRFGSAKAALGRQIKMGTSDYSIVGVLPGDLSFPPKNPAQAWVPLPSQSNTKRNIAQIMTAFLSGPDVLVRAAPGLSEAHLTAALVRAQKLSLNQLPAMIKAAVQSMHFKLHIQTYAQRQYGPIIAKLKLLELAALLLFLLVLANLAGLATADTLARRHEFAARAALGAGSLRLYAERVRELAVLGFSGWVVGAGVGWLGSRALSSTIGQAGAPAALSVPVLLLTLVAVLVVVALLATGGVHRLHTPHNLLADLMTGSRATGGKRLVHTLRALIVLQLAASVVLLVVAGHFHANIATLSSTNLGFNPRHLAFAKLSTSGVLMAPDSQRQSGSNSTTIIFSTSGTSSAGAASTETPSNKKPENSGKIYATSHEILSRLQTAPGIEAAGAIATIPLSGANMLSLQASVGGASRKNTEQKQVGLQIVSHGILEAMGMKTLAGNPDAIFDQSPQAAFIDERSAHEFFPTLALNQVIGKDLHIAGNGSRNSTQNDYRIEAVVANLKVQPYTPREGQVYIPLTKSSDLMPLFAVRSKLPPNTLRRMISDVIQQVSPGTRVTSVKSAQALIAKAYAKRIQLGRVFGVLAIVALLIAAVGLFALLAYRSLVRRPEFAIRSALGASPNRLFRSVITEALVLWLLGGVIGIPAAYGLSTVLASYLPALGLPEPLVVVLVVATLCAVAMAATLAPARRASYTSAATDLHA